MLRLTYSDPNVFTWVFHTRLNVLPKHKRAAKTVWYFMTGARP